MSLNFIKILRYVLAGWTPLGQKYCSICDHTVWRFMPYRRGSRSISPFMQELRMIGSDVDHFECPRCGSHDRERHLIMYLRAAKLIDQMPGKAILHFAPEKHLRQLIKQTEPAVYVPCDLYPQSSDVQRVDMENIEFDAETFDFVIANHVLEHVNDVQRSLEEMERVLKPAGYAVLQTPFSQRLQSTWSDPGIDSPQARLQAFGQEDHVRVFGQDIFTTITKAGFLSLVAAHKDVLQNYDSQKYGVNILEPFFLFQKNPKSSLTEM